MPFPSPGDLTDPGIEPESSALQADSLLSELWGNPEHHLCAFPILLLAPFTDCTGLPLSGQLLGQPPHYDVSSPWANCLWKEGVTPADPVWGALTLTQSGTWLKQKRIHIRTGRGLCLSGADG